MGPRSLLAVCVIVPSLLFAQSDNTAPSQAVNRISREVRHEILMLPFYNVFDDIKFSVRGYEVGLAGWVTDPALKNQAANVVKQIEGVEKVDNQIQVLPPSSSDDALRLQLYRAIYGFSSLEKYSMPVIKPIRIIVNMGRVNLEGVVDNETDKNLAGIRANGIPGIFSVTNNLVVVSDRGGHKGK